jgi:hypothetical protein
MRTGIVFVNFAKVVPFTHIRSARFTRKVLIILSVLLLGQYVFAVDSWIDGGKKSTKTFSTIKSDLSMSLKSGYHFHNYKVMGQKRSQNSLQSNSIITFQRGNVTWVMPHRSKSKVLQKFKTPEKN